MQRSQAPAPASRGGRRGCATAARASRSRKYGGTDRHCVMVTPVSTLFCTVPPRTHVHLHSNPQTIEKERHVLPQLHSCLLSPYLRPNTPARAPPVNFVTTLIDMCCADVAGHNRLLPAHRGHDSSALRCKRASHTCYSTKELIPHPHLHGIAALNSATGLCSPSFESNICGASLRPVHRPIVRQVLETARWEPSRGNVLMTTARNGYRFTIQMIGTSQLISACSTGSLSVHLAWVRT